MTVEEAVAGLARLAAMYPTVDEVATRMRRRQRQGLDPFLSFFAGWNDATLSRIRMVNRRCSP
jgi:hypothetical protein